MHWDEENRLTKTVDTTNGSSIATSYAYDAKGMRISKDGPYGKTIYVDTGYVLSNDSVISNHVFMGNTRIASIVKHTEETQPATYYYASDHLGSSSVLTTQTGSYHERIEYLPYGEVWVHNKANANGYTTPYKFTGKEQDPETGLYYFGARYYDARVSRWISADPLMMTGEYLPSEEMWENEAKEKRQLTENYPFKNNFLENNPNVYTTAHLQLPGMGGVYNPINADVYHYAGNNPVKFSDPNGLWTLQLGLTKAIGAVLGGEAGGGFIIGYSKKRGFQFGTYAYTAKSIVVGASVSTSINVIVTDNEDIKDVQGDATQIGGSAGVGVLSVGVEGVVQKNDKPNTSEKKENGGISINVGLGVGEEGHVSQATTQVHVIKEGRKDK